MIDLSIIIPIHNERTRLVPGVMQAHNYLQQQDFSYEILLCENGSTDNTRDLARLCARAWPNIRALNIPMRGKGAAVRYGMLEAVGNYRFMADIDWSMPATQISRFWMQRDSADILIADREHAHSHRYGEPITRHLTGRVFNAMVQALVLPGVKDSQCGFKLFTAKCAVELFSLQTLPGMSFDVELLYLANRLGYVVRPVAIDWYADPDSRVRLIEDSLQMLGDIIKIRQQAQNGIYATNPEHLRPVVNLQHSV